ncbi:MAG TPA: CHAT domain-containing tetratricopeptide repeat protein [Pyrinomonadaceae bacterium]|nr:CHAT domain-containing tetratricopeptide repeat protein [Pyrinomonadaceae bacterium]
MNVTKSIASLVLGWLLVSTYVHSVEASRAVAQDPSSEGQQRLRLSIEQNESDHALALSTAQEALSLFQSANDKAGMARAYAQIGRCHLAQSDLAEATENYNHALQQWRDQGDLGEQAGALINLAYIEQRKAEWSNALAYYSEAQALIKDDPFQLGLIASGMGDLFNENGLFESALVQYDRALNYFRDAKVPLGVSRTTMDIGYTEYLQGDYPASLSHLNEALANLDPTSLHAAQCHENLGRLHISLGQYAVALQHLEPALAKYESANNPMEAERVRALIGQAYEQQGLFDHARPNYLQALGVFRKLKDRISEASVNFALGRLELKAGQLDQAEAYLKQSLEDTEDIRTISTGRDLTTAYSASVHERYEAYVACLVRKSKSRDAQQLIESAFAASELSRARSLADLLRDTQTNLLAGVDPKLAAREKTLRQAIRAKVDHRIELLSAKTLNEKDLNEVETNLARLRTEHEQVYAELRKLNPAYGEITQPAASSLQQIQSEIENDQTAVLEYLLGDYGSYAWVVTRSNIKLVELPDEATITSAVQKVYDLLAKRPGKETETQLTKAVDDLSSLVIAPLADQLTAQRIIVVADGALNYVPFQLLTSPNDRQPLIASHEIVNAPSASILSQLNREKVARPSFEKTLIAFGYPAFASNYAELKGKNDNELVAQITGEDKEHWGYAMRDIEINSDSGDVADVQPLLHSRAELATLKDVGGSSSSIVTGFSASRETFQHTDFSKFSILHVATHGVLDPKRPEYSGFILSTVDPEGRRQEGFITVGDIFELQAPVDLVVLSACRTGLGKDVRGEGLIGLTRGFMYAGASSVAATLWNVDDEVTAELMKLFYANMLDKGMVPAAALRAAQNTIRQQPQWRSPHYWAGFTFQGEYKLPVKPTRSTAAKLPLIIAGVLLLVLLLVGVWWYWRRRRATAS